MKVGRDTIEAFNRLEKECRHTNPDVNERCLVFDSGAQNTQLLTRYEWMSRDILYPISFCIQKGSRKSLGDLY